jgi:hypothetical protein
MGLMDRVKAQATVLAQKTQETAKDSKAKLDQAQARRRADAMLRDLGTAVYAERTGRSTTDTDSKIDKLVAGLAAYETEHGVNLAAGPSAQAAAGGTGDSADGSADSAEGAAASAEGAGSSAEGSGASAEGSPASAEGSGSSAEGSAGSAEGSGAASQDTGTTQV